MIGTILMIAFALAFLALGYLPLVMLVLARDRCRLARRRPIDEVLKDAVAEGRISEEQFSRMMDEVHRSMPNLDTPYPLVREWMEYKP